MDRHRGLKLITAAAEQLHPEAMDKLFTTYHNGIGTAPDYRRAAIWGEKLYNCQRQNEMKSAARLVGRRFCCVKQGVQEARFAGNPDSFCPVALPP